MSDEEQSLFDEMTEEQKEKLKSDLSNIFTQMFYKVSVIVDCPYAYAVEYGTTPAKKGQGTKEYVTDPETGKRISAVKLKFRNWIAEKEHVTGAERVKRGDAIYEKVMEKGMSPHPYIRPALEDMFRTYPEEAMHLTSEEDVSLAYAVFLANRMKYYLETYKSDVTHTLKDSIKVEPTLMAVMEGKSITQFDPSEEKYHWKPGDVKR